MARGVFLVRQFAGQPEIRIGEACPVTSCVRMSDNRLPSIALSASQTGQWPDACNPAIENAPLGFGRMGIFSGSPALYEDRYGVYDICVVRLKKMLRSPRGLERGA